MTIQPPIINEFPLVSCLCITQNKFELLVQAIECFLFQTYPVKELVIVYESNNPWITESKKYESDSIRFIEVPINPKKTLGELRNISVTSSRGEYVIQWDDDDLYHPDRIKLQFDAISKSSACGNVVKAVLIYDQKMRRAFLFNNYAFDGSMLIHKDTFLKKVKYPPKIRGEDVEVRNKLLRDGSIVPIPVPFTYMYRFHTKNTWDEKRFRRLYSKCIPLSDAATRLVAAANFLPDATFLKITFESAAMRKNASFPTTVSTILHQSCSSRTLAPHSAELTSQWKALHPGWTYKLWTEQECMDFVEAVYPEFSAKYQSFPYSTQRFDVVRYLILQTYGGVYLDLDMFPLKALTFLESCTEFVMCKEPLEATAIDKRDFIVSNGFMASPPQYPFIKHLIDDMSIYESGFKDRNNTIPDTIGSCCIRRVYNHRPEGVLLLDPAYFMPPSYQEVDDCVSQRDILKTDVDCQT